MKTISHLLAALAAATLVAGTAAPAIARDCYQPEIFTIDNETVPGYLKVSNHATCRINLASPWGGISDVEILKEPKHGEAGIVNGFRVYYKPKRGFVGTDTFTYTRVNMDRYGNKARRTVEMTVEVLP